MSRSASSSERIEWCPSCQSRRVWRPYARECLRCEEVGVNLDRQYARKYVAQWFKDNPLRVPYDYLAVMQET